MMTLNDLNIVKKKPEQNLKIELKAKDEIISYHYSKRATHNLLYKDLFDGRNFPPQSLHLQVLYRGCEVFHWRFVMPFYVLGLDDFEYERC